MTTQVAPRLKSVGKTISGDVDTAVYTCPANFTAKVTLVFVCNRENGALDINIKWDDVSNDAPHNILYKYRITNHSFLQLSGSYLVLNSGDSLIVSAEQNDANYDVVVSVEEYYDPAQKG
jgi:hypothetical protein